VFEILSKKPARRTRFFYAGIWAVDLANQVSDSVEIHGSDVSDANFPPSHPPNVRFSVASVTSLPSEWSNKFNLVNQRLLFAALLAKEWPEALAEIYRVLKPGGAVQLIEMDPRFPVPETPVNVQIRDATWKASDLLGLHFGVAGSLSDLLQAAGFVDIVDETRRMPLGKSWGEIGVQGTLSIAGGFRNVSGVIEKTGLFSSKEEYERLTDKLSEEWDVHGNHYPCKVVCARKPS